MTKLIIKNKIFIVIRNNKLHSNIDFTTKINDYTYYTRGKESCLVFVCI